MRRPAAQNKPRTSEMTSFPAPVGGWTANRNLATPNANQAPSGAIVLQNMFPTATSAVMRRGSEIYATLGEGLLPVTSMFTYVNGAQEEMFAANENIVYNVTTIISPTNYVLAEDGGDIIETDIGDVFGFGSTDGLDVLTGQTGGNWVVVQFATAGGVFLRGVNGQDTPFVYDGTTFSTSPALTFAGGSPPDPEDLSYVWAYKNRLFFIQKESLDAWYLPVDSIGGSLTKLPLGGVFGRGGSLLFGYTWSLDSGNQGGLSEQCIFVTTEGEVAVFQGGNPSDANDWSKVGVYRIGKPLGSQAFIRAGGDLVIATSIGFVPLSQAIQKDYAALSPSAVSFPIETAWNDAVALRGSSPWYCEVWPSKQMVIVSLPTVNEQAPVVYVANTRTGAWGEFTNWNTTCLCLFKDRMFSGSVAGKVVELNVTGLDQGLPYTAAYVPLFDDLRTPASLKVPELARPIIRAKTAVGERVSIQADFALKLPPAPSAPNVPGGNQWGVGIWGQSDWGGVSQPKVFQNWASVSGPGYALAPSIQITSGNLVPLDAELIRTDLTYQTAEIVT